MKKILIIFLFVILIGCQSNNNEYKVIVPNGMPSIAQSLVEYNQKEINFSVERVSGPQSLIAAFTSNSHDYIIAPINLGANLYQKGSSYRLAAIITWGNLQFVSSNPINDLSDLEAKEIVAFGEGTINQMIIEMVLNSYDFNTKPTISYQASSTQESMTRFLQDDSLVAVMAEPTTSIAKTMTESFYRLDIANIWLEISGYDNFPQAGVFIKDDLSDYEVTSYLNNLETSLNYSLANPDITGENCESMDYPFSADIISESINQNIIDFKLTSEIKPTINDFYQMIYNFNPNLIGDKLPDDDFYWIE